MTAIHCGVGVQGERGSALSLAPHRLTRAVACGPRPWPMRRTFRCRGPAPRQRPYRGSSGAPRWPHRRTPPRAAGSRCVRRKWRPRRSRTAALGRRADPRAAARCSGHRDRNTAAGFEPERFQKPRLVGHQIDHAVRNDHVGCVVGDRQVFELTKAKFHIGGADLAGVVARLRDISCVISTPITRPVGLTARGQKAVEPGTTAQIDDHLAGFHRRNGQRIATARPRLAPSGTAVSSSSE